MEFFVDMTTHVPRETPKEAVDDVRSREAANSRDLAIQGHLLRLWRPPLKPAEWRTLGLFAADDERELETLLASMPLHVWRTDEVTALTPHPNDPGHLAVGRLPEFLSHITINIPEGMPAEAVKDAEASEAARANELAQRGNLERLWVLPGPMRSLALWRAWNATDMEAILRSLPMDSWLTTQITPLTPHPSDPAVVGSFAKTMGGSS
jgi:muconolactone delta-isomerase